VPIPRIYHPSTLEQNIRIKLPAEAAHHAAKVLRLRQGDEIILFDGSGGEYAAKLHEIDRSQVIVNIDRFISIDRESKLKVCLAQGLATGEKMDTIIQKAVELGVHRIQPLSTKKSVVRLTEERASRRSIHWQQVAIAACEQCGRTEIPAVSEVEEIDEWLQQPIVGPKLILSPTATIAITDIEPPSSDVTLLIGPEAGFTKEELQQASDANFTAVKIGPRILRTETAGMAVLATIQALWGDF
jgi:16S rRNA (uracil1498-N3)-methyltransferase